MNNQDLLKKYEILNLDNYILDNLRNCKNEKSVYLKDIFSDIFTDINLTDFVEMYELFVSNMPTKFKDNFVIDKGFKLAVALPDFINAIIMKSFINRLDLDNVLNRNSNLFTLFNFKRNDIQILLQKNNYKINLFQGYCIAKYKLDQGIYPLYSNIYSNLFRFNQYYFEVFKFVVNQVKDLLADLEFNSKNNIAQCSILGFYFHRLELLSFYDIDNKSNLLDKFNSSHFKNWKEKTFFDLNNKNYIYRYFISNVDNVFISPNSSATYLMLCNYSTEEREHNLPDIKFIKEINTALFIDDSYFKDKNYLHKFISNKNKLRSCYDDVLKLLNKLYFGNEINNQDKITTYGIELECFSMDNAQDTIIKDIEENYLKGRAICKSDGSIGHNGIEIVSVPMSFNYIKNTNLYFDFYNQVKNILGSYSRESTGVHIHISRNTLTRLNILRIINFINNPKNFNFLAKIAGREFFNNHYCEATFKNYTLSELNFQFNKQLINQNKYTAVNLMHKNTVELRIFKGNIRPDVISRYIEFTDCLVNFVKNTNYKLNDYISFIEFADSKKEIYPFLYAFNQKEIISNGKKEFKSLANGYKFLKLLDKKNITYKPIKFEFVETVKLPKVRKSRNKS